MSSLKKIRDILFEELDAFRKTGDIERARTIVGLTSQAVYSIRMEVENKKIELELGKADEEVKKWMAKDFTDINSINRG